MHVNFDLVVSPHVDFVMVRLYQCRCCQLVLLLLPLFGGATFIGFGTCGPAVDDDNGVNVSEFSLTTTVDGK
jgi:hypothetical protein